MSGLPKLLQGHASRRTGGELQIDRAATKRAEEARRTEGPEVRRLREHAGVSQPCVSCILYLVVWGVKDLLVLSWRPSMHLEQKRGYRSVAGTGELCESCSFKTVTDTRQGARDRS